MGPAFRPCGACRALVPADQGCTHWRIKGTYRQAQQARRKEKEHRLAAKERLAADIARFHALYRNG